MEATIFTGWIYDLPHAEQVKVAIRWCCAPSQRALRMVHPRGADTAVGDVSSCCRGLRCGERLDVAEL